VSTASNIMNNISLFTLANELTGDVGVQQKEQRRIVAALNETVRKLEAKTEANKREIETLKHAKEEGLAKIKENQAKLNVLVQQHVSELGKRDIVTNVYIRYRHRVRAAQLSTRAL